MTTYYDYDNPHMNPLPCNVRIFQEFTIFNMEISTFLLPKIQLSKRSKLSEKSFLGPNSPLKLSNCQPNQGKVVMKPHPTQRNNHETPKYKTLGWQLDSFRREFGSRKLFSESFERFESCIFDNKK